MKIIEQAFQKVRDVDRNEALKRVERVKHEREACVVTFHPSLPSVTSIIRKHWNVMTSLDEELADCFKKPSVVAYS